MIGSESWSEIGTVIGLKIGTVIGLKIWPQSLRYENLPHKKRHAAFARTPLH